MHSLQPGDRPAIFVDAMEIGTEIAWSVGSGRPGRIGIAARFGFPIRVSTQVASEVPATASLLTERRGLEGDQARQMWAEECLTWVEVVQPGLEGSTDLRVVATVRADATDVETALCAVQASPSLVLSKDHSLIDAGLAAPDTVVMLDALLTLAEVEVGAEITFGTVAAGCEWIADRWGGLSPAARTLAVVGVALLVGWLLWDADRRSATADAALETLRVVATGADTVATSYIDAKASVETHLVV
jgi:hypothetical protein